MAFTYDLNSSDAETARIARVRFALGDDVAGLGPLPTGGNFSDEEIASSLAVEENDEAATVRALSSTLARRWAGLADLTVGPRSEKLSQVAEQWRKLAGGASATSGGGPAVDDSTGGFNLTPVRL